MAPSSRAPLSPGAEPALAAIRAQTDFVPEWGLILGSGLGELAGRVEAVWAADYRDLPQFPRSTVAGHEGRLLLGMLEGRRVCAFLGRFHFYEGHSMREVAATVRLLADLGARALVVTNAAGIVNPRLAAGQLMVVSDQLNLMWTSPLVGRRPLEVRDMFPDMSEPYDPELRRLLREAAVVAGIPCVEGVYAGLSGPSYETPAEIELLRRCGADAVGMSTVPEVIAARERGLRVAGISCLTNYAAGLAAGRLEHGDVVETAERLRPALERLIAELVRSLPFSPAGAR